MKYVVLGAGQMGRAAAWYLNSQGDQVTIIDSNSKALDETIKLVPEAVILNESVENTTALKPVFESAEAAISCVPYYFNLQISKLCINTKTHLVDLGGNNDVVDQQFKMSEEARESGITIIPDCGLAPGMIGIWAMEGANELDECERISMYCGGLPQKPQPPLNYMQVFSINGLINEYIEPCRILVDGELVEVEGMSGLEIVEFPEPYGELEAFFTSGGTSTLVNTLRGRVESMEYKTLRYPGHIAFFKTLNDLGFLNTDSIDVGKTHVNPRALTQELLARNLPTKGEDVTLLRVDCEGEIEQKPALIRFQCVDTADSINDLSSMMRCTSFPAAIIARFMARNIISVPGTQPQELVVPPDDLRTELAKHDIVVDKLISFDYEEIA
jgi:lysine 6-dehydrogenase